MPAAPRCAGCSPLGAEAVCFLLLRGGVADRNADKNTINNSNAPSVTPLPSAKGRVLVAGVVPGGPGEQGLVVGSKYSAESTSVEGQSAVKAYECAAPKEKSRELENRFSCVGSDRLLEQPPRGILKFFWLIPHFQGDRAVLKAGLEHLQVEKDVKTKCTVCRLSALCRSAVRREDNGLRGFSVSPCAPCGVVRRERVLSLCRDTSHPLSIISFLASDSLLTLAGTANTIL